MSEGPFPETAPPTKAQIKLIREVIDPSQFNSPAANPVQNLQKTVNDVVESGVFTSTSAAVTEDRLSSLLSELDSVKSRLDAVLVKDAA